jgi:AcrR family transcriptional regulator
MVHQSVKVQQRKEARREELIQSAFTLFMERGFAATRLEDVATAAGVAKGTVVVYFPTKEALFTAVVQHYLEPQLAKAEEVLHHTGSPRDRLIELIRFIHGSLLDPHIGGIPKLIVSEVGNFPDLARNFHEEVCQRSKRVQIELINQGIAAGQFRPVDPDLTARTLMDPVLMHAIWRHSLGRYECDPVDPHAYLEAHLDNFLRGLAAPT